MRRQTVVWKFFLPTEPFFLVRIVRQVDGDVFLSATAVSATSIASHRPAAPCPAFPRAAHQSRQPGVLGYIDLTRIKCIAVVR